MWIEASADSKQQSVLCVPGPAEFPGSAVLSVEAWQRVARSFRLSDRELQIAKCIFDQQKEAAIARKLGIAAPTVHIHLRRMYDKLAVHGRVELVICIFAEYLRPLSTSPDQSAAMPELPAAACRSGVLPS